MHSVKEPVPPFVPEHEQMPGRKPAIGAQMASSSLQVTAVFAGVFASSEPEFVAAAVAGPEEGVAEGVAEGVEAHDAAPFDRALRHVGFRVLRIVTREA